MKTLLTVCAVLLVLPCLAFAGLLPDTEQTKCWDADGIEINPCPQPGEPFYGQDAQYVCNPHSYTQLGGGIMVRDNVTGLIWEVKTDIQPPNPSDIHYKGDIYNWYDAQSIFIATLNSENFGGYADWRLPTVKELSRLVDRNIPQPGPKINTFYFPNTRSNNYWTYNTDVSQPDRAWEVDFNSGFANPYDKSFPIYSVRAVRGGQFPNSFKDNDDETITDSSTGLMWQKDTAPGTYTWEEALHYCDTIEHAGYYDWRLPNINELQSIVDYNRYNPAIDPIFSNTVSPPYFSSTSTACIRDDEGEWLWLCARTIGFQGGDVGYSPKPYGGVDWNVRAVRGGCGSEDSDEDGIPDAGDNCPSIPNGPDLGACTSGSIGDPCVDEEVCGVVEEGVCVATSCTNSGNIGEPCDVDDDCDVYGFCSINQEDTYPPPDGNGIGDACDCEADFNCDGNVDGGDIGDFIIHFGRSQYNNPCSNAVPCLGDFNCDGNVDGGDVGIFIEDFGRSQYFNPCPECDPEIPWCVYP